MDLKLSDDRISKMYAPINYQVIVIIVHCLVVNDCRVVNSVVLKIYLLHNLVVSE